MTTSQSNYKIYFGGVDADILTTTEPVDNMEVFPTFSQAKRKLLMQIRGTISLFQYAAKNISEMKKGDAL